MPAIYLFQRRTLYGGDDLHLFALSTAAVRLCQLACYGILVYYIVHHVENQENPYTTTSDSRNNNNNNVWRDHSQDVYLPSSSMTAIHRQDEQNGVDNIDNNFNNNHHHNPLHHAGTFGLDMLQYALVDANNNNNNGQDCRHSHLFPLLLMSFTAAGIIFCAASFILLAQVYYWSSQGCPTVHRHPRTKHMEPLLEWILFPLTIFHALIFGTGLSALVLAYRYAACNDDASMGQASSQVMQVLWILAAILLLVSQFIEIVWNFVYVGNLYYSNPHALGWARADNNHNHNVMAVNDPEQAPYHYPTHPSSRGGLPHPQNGITSPTTQSQPHYNNHELLEEMWADRMHNCCRCLGFGTCYMFGGRELYGTGASHYGAIARAIADYMETRGALDVVPSDLMAGFLVLQQVQQVRRHSQRAMVLQDRELSRRTASTFAMTSGTDGSSSRSSVLPSGNGNVQTRNLSSNVNGVSDMSNLRLRRGSSFEEGTTSLEVTTSGKNPLGSASSPIAQSFRMPLACSITATTLQAPVTIHEGSPTLQDPLWGSSIAGISSHSEQRHPKGFHRVVDPEDPIDLRLVVDGARYSKYALAIYTWYLYLYVHPITGLPRLCAKSWASACGDHSCLGCFFGHNNTTRRPSTAPMISRTNSGDQQQDASNTSSTSFQNTPSPPSPTHTSAHHSHHHSRNHRTGRWEGDNICQAHKHALLLTAGLEDEADLVYVQLKSSLNQNPYCILLDHEKQVVVVSVRGTFSLEDCVTDVLLEPESLEQLGNEFGFGDVAKGQFCHGGILLCTRNVHRDLQRHGWLEYLLESKYPDYQLRLVGHSLGAACSTLLGYMLRPKYPTLQVFNFSPPGCTFSWNLAVDCQPWCTSFVLDTELIPRLSFDSLEQLRDECLELIGRIKVPKIEVARRVATQTMLGGCRGDSSRYRAPHELDIEWASDNDGFAQEFLEDLLFKPEEIPAEASSYRQQLDQFRLIQSERRSTRGFRRAIKLYPPGKMLHLVKTDEVQTCWVKVAKCLTLWATNAGSQYTPVWIGNADLNEIVVSPTMGTDHFPDRMVNELRALVQGYGLHVD